MAKDDGGMAFPLYIPQGNFESAELISGISIRDYFAAKALQGLIINPETCSGHSPITARAYELADAMIERRGE